MKKLSLTDNGEYISLTVAAGYTSNYQSANPGATMAFLFDADVITGILSQTGTGGLRIYPGIPDTSTGQLNLVIVGVDSDGNDQTEGYIADLGTCCPPNCSESNPLNGGTSHKHT